MAHPDWVLKHKVKNSEIRCINGRYYLYAITAKWDPSKKRTKKVTLAMLGTIKEKEGFIPKGQSKKGRPAKESLTKNISIKEFGATHFLQHLGVDIIKELQKCFPTQWQSLLVLAINRLIYQAPLKNNDFLLEESFLSEQLREAKLDKNACTQLLQEVGSNREKIVELLRRFIQGAEHIVFDASHITSQSEKMKMAQKGYNNAREYDPQVNLFYMFSVDKQEPTYYRLFPGNIAGVSALQNCLEETQINNCIAIGDKGFCSEHNIDLLEKAKISYILPLKRNSQLIDYTRLEKKLYQEAFDGHFMHQERPIFYTCLAEKEERQVIIFTDKSLALEEERTYLRQISNNKEGYTLEGYKEKQISFGTIAMITNCKDKTPSKIYQGYKTRMEVETVFDTYKNLLEADRTYMQSDRSMEGWTFINHLATMLYYRVFNLLKRNDLLKSTSVQDLLLRLSRINKIKINNSWVVGEINSKTAKLMHKLNINIPIT